MLERGTIDVGQSPTVLIVDDDDVFGRWLVRQFRERRVDAVHTASLADARGRLSDQTFDAFVIDVKLAGNERGTDLLADIRAMAPLAPIIVCTGWRDAGAETDALRFDAAFAEKYLDADVLSDIVAWVEHSRDRRPRDGGASGSRPRRPALASRRRLTPHSVLRTLVQRAES